MIGVPDNRNVHRLPAGTVLCIAGIAALLLAMTSGCASQRYASVRKAPENPLADKLQLASWLGPRPSERTMQTLRRYGLADKLSADPSEVLIELQKSIDRAPLPEAHYAMAELAYLAGKRRQMFDELGALDLYGAAVTHSFLFLFDERPGCRVNPYDPEFRGACDVYNTSLESALRIVQKQGGLKPGQRHRIETCNRQIELAIVPGRQGWAAQDFDRFEFVSDYEIRGLTNHYRSYGLGVPLIAVRKPGAEADPRERYYPPGLSFPVTAFLRVHPEGLAERASDGVYRTTLELYDPLATTYTQVGSAPVPLESDLTTPLAYFLDHPTFSSLETLGLLRPERAGSAQGLYMVRPYEPGKIPVLMVHGLWSSPLTWMEMFNDLGNDPAIRDRYQFWFYLYPTGNPLWISAAQLRTDLAEARSQLDPTGRDVALDQMVVVGHSMGGLLGKLQTVDGGDDFWKVVSKQPIQQVKADPEVRQALAETFYFRRNPSVKRLVTIGTPHLGSNYSNNATQWVFRRLIRMPSMFLQVTDELYRNNPGAFPNDSLLAVRTGIDSLAPTSPILPVIYQAPRPPDVRHHNIVGVVSRDRLLGKFAGESDGVVKFASAHLDNADSELVVDADHVRVHRHPHSVLEVRRILLAHLHEVQQQFRPQGVQFAGPGGQALPWRRGPERHPAAWTSAAVGIDRAPMTNGAAPEVALAPGASNLPP